MYVSGDFYDFERRLHHLGHSTGDLATFKLEAINYTFSGSQRIKIDKEYKNRTRNWNVSIFDLIPSLNIFSSVIGGDAGEILLTLESTNTDNLNHLIEVQISLDGETWVNNGAGEDFGDGAPIVIAISDLQLETEYFIRWKSKSSTNSYIYTDWSDGSNTGLSGA